MHLKYRHLTTTTRYLTVHAAITGNGADRMVEVRVPLASLLEGHVTSALDSEVRRELMRRWDREPVPPALFEV